MKDLAINTKTYSSSTNIESCEYLSFVKGVKTKTALLVLLSKEKMLNFILQALSKMLIRIV